MTIHRTDVPSLPPRAVKDATAKPVFARTIRFAATTHGTLRASACVKNNAEDAPTRSPKTGVPQVPLRDAEGVHAKPACAKTIRFAATTHGMTYASTTAPKNAGDVEPKKAEDHKQGTDAWSKTDPGVADANAKIASVLLTRFAAKPYGTACVRPNVRRIATDVGAMPKGEALALPQDVSPPTARGAADVDANPAYAKPTPTAATPNGTVYA